MVTAQVIASRNMRDGRNRIQAYAVMHPPHEGRYKLSMVFCPERGKDKSVEFYIPDSVYNDALLAFNDSEVTTQIFQQVYIRSHINPRRVRNFRFN